MTTIKTRFAKSTLAAGLAAALALSPITAAPARADNPELGAVIGAGVLALVLGGIIASESQGRGRVTVTTPSRGPDRDHRTPPPRVNQSKTLPSSCDFVVRRGRDAGTYYGKSCLRQNFRAWRALPDRCETSLNTRNQGRIQAYSAQCLARFGYNETGRGNDRRDTRARR